MMRTDPQSSGPALHEHKLRVAKLRDSGVDVIDLAAADVREAPLAALIESACRDIASDERVYLYGNVPGLWELRCAIAQDLSSEAEIAPENIIITAGANAGVVLALLATTAPGVEVALPSPHFFNHATQVELLGCALYPLQTWGADGHELRPAALAEALARASVAAALISNPRNPTATEFAAAGMLEMCEIAAEAGKPLIVDESYREFSRIGGSLRFPLEHAPIRVGSLSKSYCLAGWRVGYMVVPDAWLESVLRAQDALLIHAAVASQRMALAALRYRSGDDYVERLASRVARAQTATKVRLVALPWVHSVTGDAGTFLWVHLAAGRDSDAVADRLLAECGVGVLSGRAFGSVDEQCLRIGVACVNEQDLERALKRLEAWAA